MALICEFPHKNDIYVPVMYDPSWRTIFCEDELLEDIRKASNDVW